MFKKENSYIILILLHVFIGFAIFFIEPLAKIYPYLIVFFGFIWVVKKQNINHEVLFVCGYIVGVEVFLRMTKSSPLYEFGKYGVMFFILLGIYYNGFLKGAIAYWVFLILLIPSLLIATEVLNFSTDIRKTIAFNISGPVCLGIASVYTIQKEISVEKISGILLFIGLPIVSCATYLYFYSPDNLREEITGTASNSSLSGGFGPNQVATILGLGMFIFITRLVMDSKTKKVFLLNIGIGLYICYRGMLTFSRGGMITGLIMIFIFLFYIYINSKNKGKYKLNFFFGLVIVALSLIWAYTSYQTNGLIEKRYTNKDALGRVKEDQFTGRGELAEGEINMFLDNPIFGVGVAKGSELRSERDGREYIVASHDELTRMLAEHGSLGIVALLILIFTPLVLYFDNKQNIYLFPLFIFWFLTINHAAMRTAAPAFVYALALLKVKLNEEPSLHRK